jgi:hypothetical protein
MRFFLCFVAAAVLQIQMVLALSWRHGLVPSVASCGVIGSLLLGPVPSLALDADPAQVRAIEQIMRVQGSLRYVEDDINTKGDPSSVVSQINLLVRNYQLKDNVRISLGLIADSAKREEARTHGVAAIDDLQIVSEYYDDDINNTTGQKTPPQAVLKLAVQATEAANKEFKLLFAQFPEDVISVSKSKVDAEFKQ